MTTQLTDYAGLYNDYWSREDRWESHSFRDADALVNQILSLGGKGVLDVGCGMGKLVHTMRGRGIDAQGLDIAQRVVDEGNRQSPDAFHVGSILEIPFEDDSFDTVVCTDVLEHLDRNDVPQALAELSRVCSGSLYATIATRMDRDKFWHLTVEKRKWWEDQLFNTGMRKHAAMLALVPYEELEDERLQVTVILEKIPQAALEKYPLAALAAERDLHMDMMRESGRRSDAHIARYELARQYVKPGAVILDVACGLGYGAAVLCHETQVERIIGVDNSPYAADYATANFGPGRPAEFRLGDAMDLSFLEDSSVDLVVSMETIEHLEDPEGFLAQIHRVLRTGGRVVASIPNEWLDETGNDPNPHHLHVYDWNKLREQIERQFMLDGAFAQTAGGGMKFHDAVRRIAKIDPKSPGDVQAEWWLAVGLK